MLYARLIAVLLLAAGLFGGGWYLGGLRGKTQLAALQEAQAQNTAKAVLVERAAGAAELTRVNTILKGYQDASIDPLVPGIAQRVFVYANATSCPMSSSSTDSATTSGTAAVPRGDPELERLSQATFDAGAHDAAELSALQAAWPR